MPKNHPAAPTVAVRFVGEENDRHLLFDMNAIAVAEEACGCPILNDVAFWKKPGVRQVRALLWAALLHEDEQVRWDEFGRMTVPPELTIRRAGELMQGYGFAPTLKKLLDAWKLSAAEPEKESKRPPAPAAETQLAGKDKQ
jgi:hypothetical protein